MPKFHAKFNQIALWLACTTRPDLTLLLRKDNLSDAEKSSLAAAGVDVADTDTRQMIASLRPAMTGMDQISVIFHQAVADLNGQYPPPDCPAGAQLQQISAIPNP